MKLTKLLDFIRMEADGTCWDNVTYAAYDLDRLTGDRAVARARRALGYPNLLELRSDLAVVGYRGELNGPLCRWFAWERLCRGGITRWPLRSRAPAEARSSDRGS